MRLVWQRHDQCAVNNFGVAPVCCFGVHTLRQAEALHHT